MKKRYLIVTLIALTVPVRANPLKSVARFLTNGLFYLVASSDASDKTTAQAQSLLTQLDPSQKLLAVRKFNAFGRYLFGENNTVALPYLNYVMLDENIDTLPEQEQRFVIGRSMATLAYKHRYTAMKYLIPYVLFILYEQQTSADQQKEHSRFNRSFFTAPRLYVRKLLGYNDPQTNFDAIHNLPQKGKNLLKPLGISVIGTLLSRYLSRKMEADLDRITAQKLSCSLGGIKFLIRSYWHAQESNPFITFLIKHQLVPLYLEHHIRPELIYHLPLLKELEKNRTVKGVTVLRPPRLEHLAQSLASLAPGKAYSNSLTIPHVILLFVPYIDDLLKEFPDYRDRIDNLYKR